MQQTLPESRKFPQITGAVFSGSAITLNNVSMSHDYFQLFTLNFSLSFTDFEI